MTNLTQSFYSPAMAKEQKKHNAEIAKLLEDIAKKLRSGELTCSQLTASSPRIELPYENDGCRHFQSGGEVNLTATFHRKWKTNLPVKYPAGTTPTDFRKPARKRKVKP